MVDECVITMRADPTRGIPAGRSDRCRPDGAFLSLAPAPLRWSVRLFYRCLGLKQPAPVQLPWDCVDRIGVVVTLVVDRDQTGTQPFRPRQSSTAWYAQTQDRECHLRRSCTAR